MPVIGLEPSCLFTLKDEYGVLLPGTEELARRALLLEEFLAREHGAGRLKLPLKPLERTVLLHGHCHQKAFDAMPAVEQVIRLIPGVRLQTVESSCCGMAGSFGYEAEHYEVSMAMAEASLLPAVRKAPEDALVVADGTSCRHQIEHGAARPAIHVARLLAGEGATKFITIVVDEGATREECMRVGKSIAHSPLVKTAFFASDPNLGRILCARVGNAGIADLDPAKVTLHLGDVLVAEKGGRAAGYTEEQGKAVMASAEITVRVGLVRGVESATVWTCDFSYDYVKINADYRS